jgi:hypothetical protein
MELRDTLMRVNQDTNDNVKTYVSVLNSVSAQTITFDLLVKNNPRNPGEGTCEGFASYENVYYEAVFERPKTSEEREEDEEEDYVEYSLAPENTYAEVIGDNTIVHIEVVWDRSMGIINDSKWSSNTKCTIKCSTQSGFIYQTPKFGFGNIHQQQGTGDGKYLTEMEIRKLDN